MVEQLRAWRRKKTIFPTDQQVNRQDPGSVSHPSRRASGLKGLSKMTTRSRKLGKVLLARLISRGHAEAHAQIRSSRELGDERSCETTREILAKVKADPEQGIAGVQKALSIPRDHNGRHCEEWWPEGRGQRSAPVIAETHTQQEADQEVPDE